MGQLVDCSTNGGSEGCNGGFNQYGISYIGSTGIASESAYPYRATDGTCRASSVSKSLAAGVVSGYQSVTKTNAGLQSALNTAPVSVTVDADNTWQSYRSGVLSKSCGLFGQIDHAVIQSAMTPVTTPSRSATLGVPPGARAVTCACPTPCATHTACTTPLLSSHRLMQTSPSDCDPFFLIIIISASVD